MSPEDDDDEAQREEATRKLLPVLAAILELKGGVVWTDKKQSHQSVPKWCIGLM